MRERIVEIYPSNRLHKKYTAVVRNKETGVERSVAFGDKRYQQYKDSSPLKTYSNLDHGDKKRRAAYFSRHSAGAKTKAEALEHEINKSDGFYNAKILSHRYLW